MGRFLFGESEKHLMASSMELEKLQREDHDLLLKLHGKIDTLITLQRNTGNDLADHEVRIRAAEKESTSLRGTITGIRWVLGGVAAVAGIVEPIVLFYLTKGM